MRSSGTTAAVTAFNQNKKNPVKSTITTTMKAVSLPSCFFCMVASGLLAFGVGYSGSGVALLDYLGGFARTADQLSSSEVVNVSDDEKDTRGGDDNGFFTFYHDPAEAEEAAKTKKSYVVGTDAEVSEEETPPSIMEEQPHFCQQILLHVGDISEDSTILISEENLVSSVLMPLLSDTNNIFDRKLYYYNCHARRSNSGLNCLAAIENGHLALTTWPLSKLIVLDVKVCNNENRDWMIKNVLPGILNHLQKSSDNNNVNKNVEWGYKRRGYHRDDEIINHDGESDIESAMGSVYTTSRQVVASIKSNFQRIDILEFIDTRYKTKQQYTNSISDKESYEYRNPELFRKNRILLLDFVLQSNLFGDSAYHESLVHPALFAHAHPKRVAIIGGGEGATLREVLKHNTVETAIMVEIDETLVNASKEYLPEWSDCSNIDDGFTDAKSCVDNGRSEMYYEDAIAWFIDRYSDDVEFDQEKDGLDVIIMDALDPSSVVEFSDLLYDNEKLAEALSNALGDDGIFVVQIGEGDHADEPPEEFGTESRLKAFREHLIEHDFKHIHEYQEMHCGFEFPWLFLIAMKGGAEKANFLANEAHVQMAIHKRLFPTVNGEPALKFFDGATLIPYQGTNSMSMEPWCLSNPQACASPTLNVGDPERPRIPTSAFEVRSTGAGGGGGELGVYAKLDIPQLSYMAPEETTTGMFVPPSSYKVLSNVLESSAVDNGFLERFSEYLDAYGWADDIDGETSVAVPGGIFSIMNHGCDASYNTGIPLNETEMSLELGAGPEDVFDYSYAEYNPFEARPFARGVTWLDALKDIPAGEQILSNGLAYGGRDPEEQELWQENHAKLRKLCTTAAADDEDDVDAEK